MKFKLVSTMYLLLTATVIFAQQNIMVTNWVMQDSGSVSSATGETISSSTYSATGWLKATVPGTVLSTLVDQKAAGFDKDPLYGQNLLSMEDIAGKQKRYWYRASFEVATVAGQRVWLHIDGINYWAFIYVNGKAIGTMKGAFKAGKFDITDAVTSGVNYIAVRIRGPINPGAVHSKQNGPCGENGGLLTQDGPTFIASQGWDWIPTVPDRDMGIWKPVFIRTTGAVVIREPWIKTTGVTSTSAKVPLQVTLVNASSSAINGTLSANIDGTTQFTAQTVTVDANSSKVVKFAELAMDNPRLWWPNGYGDPNLYDCNILFTPEGATAPSDTVFFKFGVREWTYQRGSAGLIFKCNGQRILIRGGNWGMDDMMKRWDLHKLENKIRYHKEMNFNMIRDWIGMTDNEPFYNFCDKYGLIVWADFWQPHSADGGGKPEPNDLPLFQENMLDKILRVRNHASVAIWCMRNETAANSTLLSALENYHQTYDGSRTVQSSSGSNNCSSGGPYYWEKPMALFNNPLLKDLHTEIGSPVVPSIESFSKFVPSNNYLPMPKEGDNPPNGQWTFHDYCTGNGKPFYYTDGLTTILGAPTDGPDLCKKAQLINYDQYRAYMEAVQAKRFNAMTGILIWMSNCVWPSLMWQTYDYYMEGTGAFYGTQEGAEPVHVMFYGSNNVQVINNSRNNLTGYNVEAATYNLDGSKAWSNAKAVSVNADNLSDVFAITKGTSTPYFLDLKLKDGSGKLVSKNFYWLPNDGTKLSSMMTMGKTALTMTTSEAAWSRTGEENTIAFSLVNGSSVCAIACRLKLTGQTSGERILPCHYNDNYFSLAPGDTQVVEIKFDEVDRKNENPKLVVSGINVDEKALTIGGIVPTVFDRVSGKVVPEMRIQLIGSNICLNNVSVGSKWDLIMYDMCGRTVTSARGAGTTQSVSTAHLRSGIYVTSVNYNGELHKSVITITR